MLGWIVLAAVAALVAVAAGIAVVTALFPPLPRDLGGAENLDRVAQRRRIPLAVDGALDAWWIAGTVPAVIVLFHGFGRTHHRCWRYASFLRRQGFHLVAVDFRSARGGRGRRPTTLGHHERRDVEAALDWVLAAPEFRGCRIGFFGESLGASVALQVAAARPEVAAIVSDGAFASSYLAMEDSCERWARVPRQPSASILRSVGHAFTGHDPGAITPIDDVPRLAGRPVFFIHALDDDRIGTDQAQALWRAAGGGHALWLIPGSGHNEGWLLRREEYERRVGEFFARHLLDGSLDAAAGRG